MQSNMWHPKTKPHYYGEMSLEAMRAKRSARILEIILNLKLATTMGLKLSLSIASGVFRMSTTIEVFIFASIKPELKNWRTKATSSTLIISQ